MSPSAVDTVDPIVEKLEHLLHDQPLNPLRPAQVESYREELDRCESIANAPPYIQADRANASMRCRQLRRMLDKQAPKPIEGEFARSEVNRLTNEVMDTIIRPAMLSRSIMRRNPQGAATTFLRREGSRPVKRAILTWKRARFALDPNTDNMDHANAELYRPEGTGPDGNSTFMTDAQIPGHMAMSPLAKENWPLGEPTAKTAVSHIKDIKGSDKDKKEHKERDSLGHGGSDHGAGVSAETTQVKVLCECGCGEEFIPRSENQKFATGRCRNRAYKKARISGQGIKLPVPLGGTPSTVPPAIVGS